MRQEQSSLPTFDVYSNTQMIGTILAVIGNGALTAMINNHPGWQGIAIVGTALIASHVISRMYNATPLERTVLSQSTLFSIFKTTLIIQSANVIEKITTGYIQTR